jgi:tRNA threonylcarbamoyladenosine biosynthesis protein TsaB
VIILALETSTEYCSVALWQEGLITDSSARVGQKHSEVLMAMLDDLLIKSNVRLDQLNGIAFGSGPGSFTGVRIACGVAQGLALGTNLPVLGICTLLALAHASGREKVIAALDARMAEVYLAAYENRAGKWQTVIEPCLCLPQEAPQIEGNSWFGSGSGFGVHGNALQAHFSRQLFASDAEAIPQARAIALLAAEMFKAGLGQDAALATPLYLRDKVALTTSERAQQAAAK